MMKSMNRWTLLAGAAAWVVALAHAGTALAQDADSGFLRDYSRLTEAKDTAGKTIRGWVSPKFTPANYTAIVVDPIVFYPEPRPSERVSAETLQQMLAYANDLLRKTLGKRFKVVDGAGPGVVRIRLSLSGVAAKGEGLKPYQYVPFAFVATMASRAATGGAPQRAAIVAETEATDSATGELLGMRVKVGTGEQLKQFGDKDPLTLERIKPLLDAMAGQAFPELGKYVKAR
jgi:hypothetical protein